MKGFSKRYHLFLRAFHPSGFWCALFLLWALGIFLRLYLLQDQILLDDEWHGLWAVPRKTFFEILGYSTAGATSPLTNLYLWMLLHSVGWSELLIRLPQILAGLAAVVLFPLWVLKVFSRRTTLFFSFFLSISPFLVFYSRNSRPYSVTLFFSFWAFMCLYQWIQFGDKKKRNGYVTGTILASCFQPSAAIGLIAPLLGAVLIKIFRERNPQGRDQKWTVVPEIRSFLESLSWIFSGLLFFYVPVMLRNPWLLGFFTMEGSVTSDTFHGMGMLMSGTAHPPLIALFFILCIAGIYFFFRNRPVFAWIVFSIYIAYGVLGGLHLPNLSRVALVLTRYVILLLPVQFLLAAAAMDFFHCWKPNHGHSNLTFFLRKFFTGGLITLYFYMLCVKSPLMRHYVHVPNNFLGHSAFQESYEKKKWKQHSYFSDVSERYSLEYGEIPEFYFQIAKDPGIKTILEYPMQVGDEPNLYYYFQYFHRKRVVAGYVARLKRNKKPKRFFAMALDIIDKGLSRPSNPRQLKFRNMISMLNLRAIKRLGVDLIILHRNLNYSFIQDYRHSNRIWRYLPVDYLEKIYRKIFGEPVYRNDDLVAFRVRGPVVEGLIRKNQGKKWRPVHKGPFRELPPAAF